MIKEVKTIWKHHKEDKEQWYNFTEIPQGYIVVHNLVCSNDKSALKQAKKLNKDFDYKIQIKEK